MLSYRHAFHAGNHADVLKHLCLLALLQRLCQKPKPLCYFETHAGSGQYKLDSEEALKTGEFSEGVGRVMQTQASSPLLQDYLDMARQQQKRGYYPGSPAWAQTLLKENHRLILCEKHSQEFLALQRWAKDDPRIHAHKRDGHEAVKALLPPVQKRGLVLIDPAYENKAEYTQCVDTISYIRKHFRSACIALWYPRLPQQPAQAMLQAVSKKVDGDYLHITLDVSEPLGDYGMYGSGMFIVQPPWQCEDLLTPALKEATRQLSPHAKLDIRKSA